MKLLIVDDHAGVRAMIRELAELADANVRESSSGDAAVAVARDFDPDFVTMDARMPGLNGIEATRQIRALCPAAQVVVVSSYDHPAMRVAALEAGASDFIGKDELTQLRPLFARVSEVVASRKSDACRSAFPQPEQ